MKNVHSRRTFARLFCLSYLICHGFLSCPATAIAQDASNVVPHVPRQGANLLKNPSIDTKTSWSFLRDSEYDPEMSRKDDGSGSLKLVTPLPQSSMVLSELIAVQPGRQYTYGFNFKTENGPTYVGGQISLHDSDRKYLRNHRAALGGTSRDGQWEEYALPFVVPDNVAYIGCQVYKGDSPKLAEHAGKTAVVWADDFYLGEGLGLQQPPSAKVPFDGAHVRVDSLGNFEVFKNDRWTPFFPLCMYSDNHRDWSVYSKQGWNTIMWTGAAHQVDQAKMATSSFNPDGMMSGFQISQYTFPNGFAFNKMDDLKTKVNEIFDQGLGDSLLLYYWDNEVNHDQWDVPVKVIETIKTLDRNSAGKRQHPIYALQGTFNNARVHASRKLVDVSGTYFGGSVADSGGAGIGGDDGFFVLNHQEKQTSPVAFAQFNGVTGPGDMRLRTYNAIIVGAKAIGYWRDVYGPNLKDDPHKTGRVDAKAWWPDFPNLRREIDALLPIIRQPHWTSWSAVAKNSDAIRIGTRDYQGDGHLIIVNQTNQPAEVTIAITGLPESATEVWDVLQDQEIASVDGGMFELAIPAVGIASGTRVLRIQEARSN